MCDRVPDGMLSIFSSSWWAICLNNNVVSKRTGKSMSVLNDPRIVHENYEKDCVVQYFFKVPYVSYMQCIIDNIIWHQNDITNHSDNSKS